MGNDKKVIDKYNPADYNNIIDAGGTNLAVLDNIGFVDENQLPGKQGITYALDKKWYPDLSKNKLNTLKQIIKRDVKKSANSVTDTTNWLLTDIDGTKVFAIYSTEDTDEPTLLYESKGKRAMLERDILTNMLEVKESVKSADRKSSVANQIFVGDRLRRLGGVQNSIGPVGRGRSDRDVRVLQGQSKRKPSPAFKSVIENIFKIQREDLDSGDIHVLARFF